MLSYQEKQENLFKQIEENFKNDRNFAELVEPVADYVVDDRICLTSVSFIPQEMSIKICEKIIDELSLADNRQYFLGPESFHLTIKSVRTISNPPNFTDNDAEAMKKLLSEIVPKHGKILFQMRGLFETPTSLSLKGFCSEGLQELIVDLRQNMVKAGVPDNKKYASEDVFFGNITLCRYTTEPNEEFRKKIKELKEIELGSMCVDKVSLITTNAVAHPSKTKVLGEYYLS